MPGLRESLSPEGASMDIGKVSNESALKFCNDGTQVSDSLPNPIL